MKLAKLKTNETEFRTVGKMVDNDNILWDDEKVEKQIELSYDGKRGELLSTNKRLLFISNKSLFGSLTVIDIAYNNIKEIRYGKGFFSGWIDIYITPKKRFMSFENVTNSSLVEFAEHVKKKVLRKDRIVVTHQTTTFNKQNIDYTGRSIVAFSLNGKKFDVSSWKELLLKVVTIMHQTHNKDFNKVLEIPGRKRQYFSYYPEKLYIAERIVDTDIYVETKLNANNIVRLCYDIIKIFGYSEEDLIIDAGQ